MRSEANSRNPKPSETPRDWGSGRRAPAATPATTDDARWKAVVARDARYDGAFVTAVLTTGIYCRPSCSARRPRRENVRFYANPDAAERAGFRACLRCRPREATRPDPTADLVRRARRYLDENGSERVTLESLGKALDASPYHLQRVFKRETGLSPRQYAESRRLGALKRHLKRKESVTMALYEAGYGSSSRLYERSAERMGMTPGAYRAGGAGVAIRYATAKTPIGTVLVGATEKGICSIMVGKPGAELAADLRREFPAAKVREDREGLARWVGSLVRHLEGRQPNIALPLDVRGTAFQWRVWDALRASPYGATRSYGEVARAIGMPRAARAVGHACATNPIAVVIPCHRVLRGGGGLGGYAGGIDIKKRLLETERRGARRARPGR
jgi:AraC family transcriptional regulator of adaptative response/methylated-DNA-[protein]-cysteine methyltransferase